LAVSVVNQTHHRITLGLFFGGVLDVLTQTVLKVLVADGDVGPKRRSVAGSWPKHSQGEAR
jgi:hypothetical protein